MGYRWIYLGYIDAHLPLTGQQRREAEKRAYLHGRRQRGFVFRLAAACIALPPAVAASGYIVTMWFLPFLPLRIAAPIGVLSAGAVCVLVFARLVSLWNKRPLRMALRDMGYEICVKCGYWLRDLRDEMDHCPECGAQREPMSRPRVNHEEPASPRPDR